jgi:hypothetical protein
MTQRQKRQILRLIDHEFVFARDMFFAPVNYILEAIRESFLRANSEAKRAVAWSFSEEENGK